MNTRIAIPLALLLAATTAGAHGILPAVEKQVCRRTESTVRHHFDFDTGALLDYAACLLSSPNSPSCTSSVPTSAPCSIETCGDFDDDYGIAKRMLLNYCVAASPSPTSVNSNDIKYVVTSSSTFGSLNHHNDYHFEEGLGGFCVYCVPLDSRMPGD